MKIIWTRHAEERQEQWQKKLNITRQDVEDLVMNPTQVVLGAREAYVAQKKRGIGLLRVPFLEVEGGRKVLTVYWTSRVEKYWKEEYNANPV